MQNVLSRLVAHEELTTEEVEEILINITNEVYPPEQVTALIMGCKCVVYQLTNCSVCEVES